MESVHKFWKILRQHHGCRGRDAYAPRSIRKVFLDHRLAQINTDWHRLRAKALSESQGNHRNRLTSVYQPERVNQGTSPCDPLGSHWTYTGGTLDSHWRNLGVIPISIKDRFPNRQESPSLQHLHWDETAIRILIAA